MKKILLFGVAALSLCLQGCLAKSNAAVTTESRAVEAAFNKIASSGACNLVLTQGSSDSVSVEIGEEWQQHVIVEVKNGTLNLSTSKKLGRRNKWWWHDDKGKDGTVYITFKSIDALQVSGVGSVETKNAIKGDRLEVRVDGVGDAALELEVKQASVSVSGVGDATLKGVAKELQLNNSGVGDVDATDLKAEKVTLTSSGVGDIEVYASMELSINNSGVGDISYSGPAIVTLLNSSGVGSIKKEDL